MDAKLKQHLERFLSRDTAGRATPRLLADANRLIKRLDGLIAMSLTHSRPNRELLAIACHALQLPLRHPDTLPVGKFGQLNLRQRAEQAAEQFVSQAGKLVDEDRLDQITQLLLDLPGKSPDTEDARLLADAINLDDFGLTGLLNTAIIAAQQGHGIDTLIDGVRKRDQYGYWDARLRDGFHFPPVRAIAEKRLHALRSILESVAAELD